MKYIRNFLTITALLFLIVSCEKISTDLNVPNLEHPNVGVLQTDPVALEASASKILNKWFMRTHDWRSPANAMTVMADINTCSWGNFGMKDLSSEPRVAFNNKSSYGNNVTSSYFNSMNAIYVDASTIMGAVKNGTKFELQTEVHLMGLVGQALAIGYQALIFDKVWLYDEDGPIDGGLMAGASSYQDAMSYALDKLDKAIALASANDFELPETWLPGGGGEKTKFIAFLNSMGARMLVGNIRNSAQKASANWAKVLTYTNAGVTQDFEIHMDDLVWYDYIKSYVSWGNWLRVDMRIINMMDPNTINYWTEDISTLPEATSVDARLAIDYKYKATNNFPATRGKYHYSIYSYAKYLEYITIWKMNVVEITKSENDMLEAEALLMTGDVGGAAAIVNAGTRVTRGKLAPVAAVDADVKAAIHYERMVELPSVTMGIGFFEMRKENLLQKGTMLHFPVPGKALESIPADYYTFGGTEGVAGEDYSTGGWKAAAGIETNYFKSTAISSMSDNISQPTKGL